MEKIFLQREVKIPLEVCSDTVWRGMYLTLADNKWEVVGGGGG